METNSFKALYLTAKAKPTPGYAFIIEVAKVTGKRPGTIRRWLDGTQSPDSKTRGILAEYFNIPENILFPKL